MRGSAFGAFLVLFVLVSCAHTGAGVEPAACPIPTDDMVKELEAMVAFGDYPAVQSYLGEVVVHCCAEDVAAGRLTPKDCEEILHGR